MLWSPCNSYLFLCHFIPSINHLMSHLIPFVHTPLPINPGFINVKTIVQVQKDKYRCIFENPFSSPKGLVKCEPGKVKKEAQGDGNLRQKKWDSQRSACGKQQNDLFSQRPRGPVDKNYQQAILGHCTVYFFK